MLRDCSSLQKTRILENCGNETLSNELTATSDKQDDGWRSTDSIHIKYYNILLKAIMNLSTNMSW